MGMAGPPIDQVAVAPLSTSEALSVPTAVPLSRLLASVSEPARAAAVFVIVGASLIALTVKETLWFARVLTFGVVPEPVSMTSKEMFALPLALATVLYFRAANSAALRLVLAVTGVEPSLLKREIKDGIAVIL